MVLIENPKIVKVTWIDCAYISPGTWLNTEELVSHIKTNVDQVVSVGYLVYKDDFQLIVAGTIGEDIYTDVSSILQKQIVSIELLSTEEEVHAEQRKVYREPSF